MSSQNNLANIDNLTINGYPRGLNELPAEQIRKWIDSFDTVLCDCDGEFLSLHNSILRLYNIYLYIMSKYINKYRTKNSLYYTYVFSEIVVIVILNII